MFKPVEVKYAYFFDNISVLSKQVCSKLIIVFMPAWLYAERYIYRKLNLEGGRHMRALYHGL